MNAYRTHAVVQQDGRIVLESLPLKSGQSVEILVLAPDLEKAPQETHEGHSLQQKLLAAPSLDDKDLKGMEEVRQWLVNWPTRS